MPLNASALTLYELTYRASGNHQLIAIWISCTGRPFRSQSQCRRSERDRCPYQPIKPNGPHMSSRIGTKGRQDSDLAPEIEILGAKRRPWPDVSAGQGLRCE